MTRGDRLIATLPVLTARKVKVEAATRNDAASTSAGRLAALVAAAFVCTRAVLDPDLWWHLKSGADLLRTRHLTSVDPYSFTQDVPWINHEWLSEAVMALVYRGGGVLGLILTKCLVLGAAFALLAWTTRRATEASRWWFLAAGIVTVNLAGTTIRPQLWTILGLAVLLHLLMSRARWYWIPLLFATWANLHGGWIVGVAVGGLWLLGRLFDARSIRAILPGAAALGLGILATLINPYGWRLWSFLFSTVRITRNLTEWHPVWQQEDPSDLLMWGVVALGIVGTTLVRHRKAVTWAAALPIGWLGVMSLFVARILPLFGEVTVLCLADAWRSSARDDGRDPALRIGRPVPGTLVIDILVVAIVCAFNLIGDSRCLTTDRSWMPDLEAASALATSDRVGRLVLPYDWGGYAIWHWGPRLKVSIDPRRETVYSEETLAVQSAIRTGRVEGLEFLNRVRPEYVWLPSHAAAATEAWLRANGYRVDVETGTSFVATRADLPALTPGVPLSRCFP